MNNSTNETPRTRAAKASSSNNQTISGPPRPTDSWWLIFVGLVTVVLCVPFLRSIIWLPDEGVLLHGAERILNGEKLYLDFFEFLPPGGFLVTAGWFALAGISFESARCLAILTIVGIACFTYLACRQATQHAA